jgi:hypothetical protein
MTLFRITNYHWSICWMICFIQFVRLSFPYWIWRRLFPYTYFRLRAHGGCDLSAEDAFLLGTWSYLRICRRSVLPRNRFCRRSVLPHTQFYNCLLDYDYVLHIVNFAILYWKLLMWRRCAWKLRKDSYVFYV